MRPSSRIGTTLLFVFGALGTAHAQTIRVPGPRRPAPPPATTPAPPTPATNLATKVSGNKPTTPSNVTVAGGSNREIDLTWDPSTEERGTISLYTLYFEKGTADNRAETKANDKVDKNKQKDKAQVAENSAQAADDADKTKCTPDRAHPVGTSTTNSYSLKNLTPQTTYYVCVEAMDGTGNASDLSKIVAVKTATASFSCWPNPVRKQCMDFGTVDALDRDTKVYSNINGFYQTTGSYSFFNQIKSIYNGASGSAIVSADLATLNMPDGMQITVTTNAQAGSSGTSAGSVGTVPTLSATGAGQAAQNIIYGGTFVVSEIYPLIAAGSSKWDSTGHLGVIVDSAFKEGADIQNFKSGTNVNVISPPFHGSVQLEGYLQWNSINPAPNSQHFAGSIFLGGSYGYSYMSHGYARDYGFGTKIDNRIGQISFGILLNGVAKITVSRAFGPSQTYTDSTTMVPTTVNNFKAWSFGIAYQSAAPAK